VNRLRPLRIDFAKRAGNASAGRLALFLLGAAAMTLAVIAFQDIQARTVRLESEYGRINRPSAAGGTAGAAKLGETVKRANAVARELARRWDRVFAAIEAARDPEVGLLAIEPDASKGIVRLTAESKSKNAMLRYLTRLQDQQPLQRVLLEHHEVRTGEPERPVRFVVSGQWEESP
jgi:hypothetical protein